MQKKPIARISSGIALLFLGLTIVILLLLGVDFHIIQPTFQMLEEKQAVEDGNRVRALIENEISNIGKLAIDWASWDDTYIFAQDQNRRYIESNYPEPAALSQNSNVDFFAIFNQSGRSLIQGTYHPDINQQVELDIVSGSEPSILNILSPIFKNEKSISGLVNTGHGIIILSAHPILNTYGQGPSRGILIMGRFLTQATLDTFSERVRVRFDLLVHGGGRLTSSEQTLFSRLAFSAPRSQQKIQQGFLYQIYPDIENNPVFFLRSQTRGEILAIGQKTRNFLTVVLFLISFALLICLIIYRARMKISKEALRDSEERYRTIFANKYTVMLLIDPTSAAIVGANPAACTYYGWSLPELKNMKIHQINTLPQEEVVAAMELARSRSCNRFVFKHRKADGTIHDVEVFSDPLIINGEVLLYTIVHDITERIQNVENLKKYAKIQAVLLREVNHRVKNNLIAIIGMLYQEQDRLELRSISDTKTNMKDIICRIEGLLSIHSLLSASQWKSLALSSVCWEVTRGVIRATSATNSIDLQVTDSNVHVDSDQAHYLAIILNELATNSIKYARTKNEDKIHIQISIYPNKRSIILVYHDDGPGYPDSVLHGEVSKDYIGFYLIKGIAKKSLQGDIEFSNDKGAMVRLTFPLLVPESETRSSIDE